jgi:hypothetical protein
MNPDHRCLLGSVEHVELSRMFAEAACGPRILSSSSSRRWFNSVPYTLNNELSGPGRCPAFRLSALRCTVSKKPATPAASRATSRSSGSLPSYQLGLRGAGRRIGRAPCCGRRQATAVSDQRPARAVSEPVGAAVRATAIMPTIPSRVRIQTPRACAFRPRCAAQSRAPPASPSPWPRFETVLVLPTLPACCRTPSFRWQSTPGCASR